MWSDAAGLQEKPPDLCRQMKQACRWRRRSSWNSVSLPRIQLPKASCARRVQSAAQNRDQEPSLLGSWGKSKNC